MLFMCSMVIGQSKKIIGKPIQIEHLEVAQNDFPKKMTWYEAKKACYALGSRWRLPTKDELNLLYTNKNEIGGFAIGDYWTNGNYWSSTQGNSYGAWVQSLNFGGQSDFNKSDTYNVRAVRAF